MLFHGSSVLIEKELKGRMNLLEYVYATDDYCYALVRAGKFDPQRFLIREDYDGNDKPFQLIEIEPNAFKQTFDRPGYIYRVNDDGFMYNQIGEYVKEDSAEIIDSIFIPNVWDEIMKYRDRYELVFYDKADSYWSKIKGGKAGYLERRRNRLSNIKELV